jgi:group I intron endonuclease
LTISLTYGIIEKKGDFIMGYIVYVHTTPNGKKYVGITGQTLQQRWQNGLGYRKSSRFYNAILKYGWENIKHEILFENLTKAEAEQKEIEYIALYKSNDKRFGYNIENGGNSVGKLSEETKKKISLKRKGIKPNDETRKKLSNAHKKENLSLQTLNKMIQSHIGKTQSNETKAKIGKKHKGKKYSLETINKMILSKKSKPFIQYTIDMEFVKEWKSASDYERQTGKNKRHIVRCLKGEIKTAYGYVWKYKEK